MWLHNHCIIALHSIDGCIHIMVVFTHVQPVPMWFRQPFWLSCMVACQNLVISLQSCSNGTTVWTRTNFHKIFWFMDVYGCLWMFMDVYGCLWMFMVYRNWNLPEIMVLQSGSRYCIQMAYGTIFYNCWLCGSTSSSFISPTSKLVGSYKRIAV